MPAACRTVALATLMSLATGVLGQGVPPSAASVANLSGARELLQRGDYVEAERVLRAYLEQDVLSAEARAMLAYTLFRENKPKESLAEYTHAARLSPPKAADLRYVALDYVLLNDYPDADKWMTQSIIQDGGNFEAWYSLGRIRYTQNRFQPAVDCFHKALELEPRSVKAANNLGLALEGLNQIDDAITAYRDALQWQQGAEHPSEQPLLNLSTILVNRNQLDDALPLLLQAQSIAPKDAKIDEQLGRLYLRLKRLSAARAQFEQAVAINPDSAPLHYQLGQVYHRQGEEERARSEFARAAQLSGTHSTP